MASGPKILRRELEVMSRSALVELAWAVLQDARLNAMLFESEEDCTMTPQQVFEIYEEKVHPYVPRRD